MNYCDNKDVNSSKDIKKYVNSSQIINKQEHNQMKKINNLNEKSIPIKQTSIHRSCLKHRSNQQSNISSDNNETHRLSSGRVSFAQTPLNDGKILINDFVEKKHQSAIFAKKAKEFQLAELNYFKDHARDKEPIDE
ncbi:unnamed protein product [Rotaria sordida]|uniref:Uncharacterized protein n=1 Tax=Rotaria sordida TaxID=392033 RepID=A0A819F064_9BILA|nr:unnamed protein product [Rotaria sordida]CAF1183927.1 unnamed protein product [Rotaria sordida]CAF1267468.1 unnamed protein product [Rotaria sordida]CAF3836716.1 unnamed protein product [Rotaria sordida]CAF3859665.1 unnamed protein product [Rotaria sordida]